MEKPNNQEDFLAKWASGELSEEEVTRFKKSKDYILYETILEGTKLLDVPNVDRKELFNKIKNESSKKKKTIAFIPNWAYAIAASIALFIGYTFLFNQNTTYQSGYGEHISIQLPDGSEAILNAKSKLWYKKNNWDKGKRVVFLNGEAFFKVKHGNTFTVKHNNNSVSVLGTKFNVNVITDFFEVICYEGKVKVKGNSFSKTITRGEAIRNINSSIEEWNQNDISPTWIIGESSFKNTPLRQVITALEKQYKVTIQSNGVNLDERYSGGFTHNNLKNALHTIFDAMNINFIFTDNGTIELSVN